MSIVRRLASTLLDAPFAQRVLDLLDRSFENRMREKGMLGQAFEFVKINGVKGSYFEFGLWRGKTFIQAHRLRRRYGMTEMTLWGFDSFRGLPEVPPDDENVWETGEFACSRTEFEAILRSRGIPRGDYRLVEGFYGDSLTDAQHSQMQGEKAAVVYVDCDLYESTKVVLWFVNRYLVNGSVVCFDDYYNYKGNPDKGEQRAIREFLAAHPTVEFLPYLDYSPLGKSFICRRRENSR